MKYLRFLVAIILTIILLFIARTLSMVRPVPQEQVAGSLILKHVTVPKIVEGVPDRITVTILNPEHREIIPSLQWIAAADRKDGVTGYQEIPMPGDSADIYYAVMPRLDKGRIIYYRIIVKDTAGTEIFRLPADPEKPIKLKYEGHVPAYIVITHIFLMFAAIYLASLAVFDALGLGTENGRLLRLAKNFRWVTVTIFLGGYPFGWAMNYFAFGVFWEGIPFGWDFTDNKTQIVLLYSIFLNLSSLGTLYKNRFGPDHYSPGGLRVLTVIGYLLVMAIYVIPHSIQFSLPITALFSYGLTAIIIGLYIYGVTRAKWTETSSRK